MPTPAIKSAIVVGGGIAGMAAALRLAEAGVRVTLLETRKKLGGRATSFDDVRSGRTLDNCQHVVLGCCTNYLDLLERLDSARHIRWYREQYWIEVGGRISVVRRGSLPAPAHFAWSMLKAPMFAMSDRLHLARACSAIMRMDRSALGAQTFADVLKRLGQPEALVRRFWSPVIVSACNLDVGEVSATSAVHVFQEGFLAASSAADIGISDVPLVRLYDRLEQIVTRAGGRVALGAGAERIDVRSVLTTDGARFEADAVVCAVPVERVRRVIAPECLAADARFAGLDQITHSPILGVHFEFDRPALGELPHAVLVDRPTQWLFRKSEDGRDVHAVISSADAWVGLDERTIGDRVLADMRACLPAFQPRGRADEPRVLSVRAIKEKLATFAPRPGVDALRPSVSGPSGIFLAGDYTDTGWPATMEGATRSGYKAAAAVLGQDASGALVPSLPVAKLAAILGLKQAG